jgi:hypothetical protein
VAGARVAGARGFSCGPLCFAVVALVGTQVGQCGGALAVVWGGFSDDAEDVGVLINFLLMVRW